MNDMNKIHNDDMEEWKRATNGVHKLEAKQMVSMKDNPVYTSPAREILGYDLHGMTVQQAFEHTIKLLQRAYEYHMDKFTIITGKSGQIRREFAGWLENPELAKYVRYYRQQSSGGSFVVYIVKH
jgi:DNA-nicking Smr family endonuclease